MLTTNQTTGLGLLLGDYQHVTSALLEENYAAPTPGPVAAMGVVINRNEYALKLINSPHNLSTIGKAVIERHWQHNEPTDTSVLICVDAKDPLEAYLQASEWIDVLKSTITEMMAANTELAAKFETKQTDDVLTNLRIFTSIIICCQASPSQNLVLGLRRLAREQGLCVVMAYSESEVSHPNLPILHNLITCKEDYGASVMVPLSRVYVVVSQDESIDTELPANEPIEARLETTVKSSPLKSSSAMDMSAEVGLNTCVRNVWKKIEAADSRVPAAE